MPLRHIFLALLVVAIWGVNFTVIKLSVTALPPFLAATLRFALAAFPALLFVPPPRVPWWRTVQFGLASSLGIYAFLNLALFAGMTAGLTSVLLQTQAFFTLLIGSFVLGEHLRPAQVAGAVLAFAGIGVIASTRLDGAGLVPLLLVLAAALSWAVANIVTKKSAGADPLALTVWGAAIGTVPLLALSLVIEGPEADLAALVGAAPTTWLVLGFLAYAATLLGLGSWTFLLRRHPASEVAPFTLLVPVTGLVSGAFFLGETISPVEALGGALVIAGLLVPFVRQKGTA